MDSSPAEMKSPPSLPRLFVSFLRLGATAFGGPAMAAYIGKLAVERNQWLDEASFRDGVALCQTIPGATAMQTAAYVGLRSRRLAGAAVCFVGFGLPAFCFMTLLSAFYARTHDLPRALAAFQGLRAMTVAIVANATIAFGKRSSRRWANVLVAAIAAAMFAIKVNPIAVILFAALLGLALYRGQAAPRPQATDGPAIEVRSRWHVAPLLVVAAAGFALLFAANRELFDLGVLMSRIDLFAFGGGFASVPLMYHEVVNVREWMDGQTLYERDRLAASHAGPIVVTATFVGYWLHGVAGAITATASSFCRPS